LFENSFGTDMISCLGCGATYHSRHFRFVEEPTVEFGQGPFYARVEIIGRGTGLVSELRNWAFARGFSCTEGVYDSGHTYLVIQERPAVPWSGDWSKMCRR
jgi:hypothetical protein